MSHIQARAKSVTGFMYIRIRIMYERIENEAIIVEFYLTLQRGAQWYFSKPTSHSCFMVTHCHGNDCHILSFCQSSKNLRGGIELEMVGLSDRHVLLCGRGCKKAPYADLTEGGRLTPVGDLVHMCLWQSRGWTHNQGKIFKKLPHNQGNSFKTYPITRATPLKHTPLPGHLL